MAAIGIALIALKLFADQPRLHFESETNLFLGPALLLIVMVAPFLTRLSDTTAFWDFNRTVWLAAALAVLAALILAIGLTSAVWAVEELFDLEISWRFNSDIWILSFGLFGPWVALSRIPRRFDAPDGVACPRALSVLITFVLVPLAIGFLLIVYAYILRILVLWDLPGGRVGTIVSSYAGFGTAVWLVIWPLRESGPMHVRLFHRYFHLVLIPPTILLIVALIERISAYGVTEPRYLLAVLAIWLLVVAGMFLARRVDRIAVVPMVLAGLLLATSFGPWGASGVSVRSQVARLEAILTSADILVDGRVIPSPEAHTYGLFSSDGDVVSILKYLDRGRRLNVLAEWFDPADLPADPSRADILLALAPQVDWAVPEERAAYVRHQATSFEFEAQASTVVSGFELYLLLRSDTIDGSPVGSAGLSDGTDIRWRYDAYRDQLWLTIDGEKHLIVDVPVVVDEMVNRYGSNWHKIVTDSEMTIDRQFGPLEVRSAFLGLNGQTNDSEATFWDVRILVAIRDGRAPTSAPGLPD